MLSLTGITPADESQLVRRKPLAFTLTTDVPGAVGVMVSVYFTATDTEEMVWDGLQFVGHYATVSVKSGDDFIILRRDGWPIGSIALRVRELGSVTIMSVWTDGTGVPSDGVGSDDDYYLDTATGQIYKRAGGTYSVIHTPATISSAAPAIGIGAGNTEGVASTYALSDHDHTIRTGATDLTVGTVTDGEFLKRVGTEIVSAEAGGGGGGVVASLSYRAASKSFSGTVTQADLFDAPNKTLAVAANRVYLLDAHFIFDPSGAIGTHDLTLTLSGVGGQVTVMTRAYNQSTAGSFHLAQVFMSNHFVPTVSLCPSTVNPRVMTVLKGYITTTGAVSLTPKLTASVYLSGTLFFYGHLSLTDVGPKFNGSVGDWS